MSLLDIICDPALGGSTFLVLRTQEEVNSKGRAVFTESYLAAIGNIQPAPGKERELLAEEDRLKAVIQVFTPFSLMAGDEKHKADAIKFNGELYRVTQVEGWQMHAGFTKALAVLESTNRHEAESQGE